MERANTDEESQPVTAEDFYDEAVKFEDSADRFFSSDLSKALRFYNKAHQSYLKSLNIQPIPDALYNLPRLEFDIYNKYTKDDAVIISDLNQCEQIIQENILLKPIDHICQRFEECSDLVGEPDPEIGEDLWWNGALCWFEYVESLCESNEESTKIIKAFQKSIQLFEKVLNIFEWKISSGSVVDYNNFTRLLGDCYRLSSVTCENFSDKDSIESISAIECYFLEKIDTLTQAYLESGISEEAAIELKLAKISERSAKILSFDELIFVWNQDTTLINNLEKKLLEGSSFRTFLDRFEGINDILKWEILGKMSVLYREIYEELRDQISNLEKIQHSENDLLSNKIALLCSVTIERADIELERSLLNLPVAIKNIESLKNNNRNILKNAIVFSKKSGGIKESAVGKLTRAKKQREAVIRLCIIDEKSQEEISVILSKYWTFELNDLSEIDAYKRFFS